MEGLLAYDHATRQPELPDDLAFTLDVAGATLSGFATLDDSLMNDLHTQCEAMRAYRDDATRRRPYNILLVAQPGSGKSHLANCLARHLDLPAVTANLAGVDQLEALQTVVDEARNHKALDRLPLMFLDEVDSEKATLGRLLTLLWDGELIARGRTLKIGRCIAICAISDPELINWVKKAYKGVPPTDPGSRPEFPKADDFLSRFGGGLFDVPSINTEARRVDRACVTLELLRRRFPDVAAVHVCFLQLIDSLTFVNEVRSMEVLLNSIPRAAQRDGFLSVDPSFHALVSDLLDNKPSPLGMHVRALDQNTARQAWSKCVAMRSDDERLWLNRSEAVRRGLIANFPRTGGAAVPSVERQ